MEKILFTSESVTEGHPDKCVMLFPMLFLTLLWKKIL